MNKRVAFRFWAVGVIFLAVVLASCGSTERVKKPRRMASAKKLNVLLDSLHDNEFNCDWLSLKLGVEFKSKKLSDSFKMFIRLRTDSVIWIQATYYAVEVARLYLTPDSVKFLDRQHKEYYVGSYDFFREKYRLDFDFNTLQALIQGNSVGLNESEHMRASVDGPNHLVSNYRQNRIRRAMEKDRRDKMTDIAYSVWIDAENYRVSKLSVNDFKQHRSLFATFSDQRELTNSTLPHKAEIQAISQGQQVDITTEYLRVQVNKRVSFPFNIPDKYERIL